MRCRNCGWENDLGALKCDKCNAPLNGSMVDHEYRSARTREDISDNLAKKTVPESGSITNSSGLFMQCPNCGYPYNPNMDCCPNCGGAVSKPVAQRYPDQPHRNISKDNDEMIKCPACNKMVPSKYSFCANCGKPFKQGTVNPWAKPKNSISCSLTPIAWDDENDAPETAVYSGNTIVLNRDNTDPYNNTITSKEQAVLTYEKGAWYIEDKSEMQTTYLLISKKMKLEDGAVIMLGDRRFIFNK